jgi:quercetin dioxygenase-like cupin family protein
MPLVHWEDVAEKLMSNSASARVVKTENIMACRITAPKGLVTATHTHPFDQITHILRGKLRFHLGEEEYRLVEEGDVLVVPAGTPHGGEVLEEAEYIDFFSALNPMFSED